MFVFNALSSIIPSEMVKYRKYLGKWVIDRCSQGWLEEKIETKE